MTSRRLFFQGLFIGVVVGAALTTAFFQLVQP